MADETVSVAIEVTSNGVPALQNVQAAMDKLGGSAGGAVTAFAGLTNTQEAWRGVVRNTTADVTAASGAIDRGSGSVTTYSSAHAGAALNVRAMSMGVRSAAEAVGAGNPVLAQGIFHLAHFSEVASSAGLAMGGVSVAAVAGGAVLAAYMAEWEKNRVELLAVDRAVRSMDFGGVMSGLKGAAVQFDEARSKAGTFTGAFEDMLRHWVGLPNAIDTATRSLSRWQQALKDLTPAMVSGVQGQELATMGAIVAGSATALFGLQRSSVQGNLGSLTPGELSALTAGQVAGAEMKAAGLTTQAAATLERKKAELQANYGPDVSFAVPQAEYDAEIAKIQATLAIEKTQVQAAANDMATARQKALTETANFERDLATKTLESRSSAETAAFDLYKAQVTDTEKFILSTGAVPVFMAFGPAAQSAVQADLDAKMAKIRGAADDQIALLQTSGRTEQQIAQETAQIKASAQYQVNAAVDQANLKLQQVADEDTARWKANLQEVAKVIQDQINAQIDAADQKLKALIGDAGALAGGGPIGSLSGTTAEGAIGSLSKSATGSAMGGSSAAADALAEAKRIAQAYPDAGVDVNSLSKAILASGGMSQAIEQAAQAKDTLVKEQKNAAAQTQMMEEQSLSRTFGSAASTVYGGLSPDVSGGLTSPVAVAAGGPAMVAGGGQYFQRTGTLGPSDIPGGTWGVAQPGDLNVNVNIGNDQIGSYVIPAVNAGIRTGQIDVGAGGDLGFGAGGGFGD
jgi:hypothetical protein